MTTSRIASALVIGGFALGLAGNNPASAITVELAKKCRAMAFKAYPPPLTGTKSKNGAQMRAYYNDCISKNGAMPESDTTRTNMAPPPDTKVPAPK